MIAAVNELRHRAAFALWSTSLRAKLARHRVRLTLQAPHGARLHGRPRLAADGPGELALRIGRGVRIGGALHIDVEPGGELTIADGVTIGHGVRLQLRGGSIALGAGTTVRDGAVLKADGRLTVGEGVLISYGAIVACSDRIDVGDRASISERVSVVDSDHAVDGTDVHWAAQPLRTSPVEIGPNVLVSANATILRGARIGANAQVAAGSVVRGGEHAAGWLHAGVPATPRKSLGDDRL